MECAEAAEQILPQDALRCPENGGITVTPDLATRIKAKSHPVRNFWPAVARSGRAASHA